MTTVSIEKPGVKTIMVCDFIMKELSSWEEHFVDKTKLVPGERIELEYDWEQEIFDKEREYEIRKLYKIYEDYLPGVDEPA